MESTFDSLVRRDFYNARKLYHGTTASSAEDIENNGINLLDCRGRTDFNGMIQTKSIAFNKDNDMQLLYC